jgi:hypothetical protein
MSTFRADTQQLVTNIAANSDQAAALRRWIEQFDDPAHYARLESSLGPIAYPVITALRRHGAGLRAHTETLIASYEHAAEACRHSAAAITGTDTTSAADVQSTTQNL